MKHPAWENVYGFVEKRRKVTLFEVGTRISNGLEVFRSMQVSNIDLERFPMMYPFILNQLVDELDEHIKNRV